MVEILQTILSNTFPSINNGTKPLPEPILTYRQCGPMTFSWGQFQRIVFITFIALATVQSMMCANSSISLSSLWGLTWSNWIYKMLVSYTLSMVCLRLSQFSQSYFMQRMGQGVLHLLSSLMISARIGLLNLIVIIHRRYKYLVIV